MPRAHDRSPGLRRLCLSPGHVLRRRLHLSASTRGLEASDNTRRRVRRHRLRMRGRNRGGGPWETCVHPQETWLSVRGCIKLLEALAMPLSSARARPEACASHRVGRVAAADRVRPSKALPPGLSPQRRHPDHRDGAEGALRTTRSSIRVQEPFRGHPRALLDSLRSYGRPLHSCESDANCRLQQSGRSSAR
jgi:hypothetical protein